MINTPEDEDWLKRWLPADPNWQKPVWRPRWKTTLSAIALYAAIIAIIYAIACFLRTTTH
jgi:hypothetical protein